MPDVRSDRPLRRRVAPLAIALLAFAPLATACSSDTKSDAKKTAESLKEDAKGNADAAGDAISDKAGEAAARAAAEDLRARIKANDTANDEGARSMSALNESIADVAGDPEVVGLKDDDGDGLDDDGKVQLDVDGASACVILPASGEDTSVEGGSC
ncbi:hypothetical protein KSP35_10600 [Aquihabitans sp. G128]|uniref:hypothetical protein n=1 Tax=Aquihabitans sp. G128 TaxID=2849779 RepID=UPI001C24D107|nr:hypothetical protein [Aquihabitans sp. G128]QXC63189.1 hypothetical protein KSP35_10600 [Aquihabitans sp. G128]